MKEKKANPEMIIELTTQEALRKISELNVDLQLPKTPPVQKTQAPDAVQNPSTKPLPQSKNQQSPYRAPVVTKSAPISNNPQPEQTRHGVPLRQATVKVKSVNAHVTSVSPR